MDQRDLQKLMDFEIEILDFNCLSVLANPTFIPIHLIGGVGDAIIAIDALRELKKNYQIMVYTNHSEALKYFFNHDLIMAFNYIPKFTWKLEFDTVAKFITSSDFHGFLVSDHSELFKQQLSHFHEHPKLHNLVRFYYHKYFMLADYGKKHKLTRRNFPLHCLGFDNLELPFVVLPREKPSNYITIHDGFDVTSANIVSNRATKQWNVEHWKQLISDIKRKYPEYRIIQLGSSKTSRMLYDVDENLVGKTTLTQAFDIIRKATLHIDADSGLVHAATRMQVPCIVMWGPTPPEFYGYPSNVNLRSALTCERSCYGVNKNWNDKCPLGQSEPPCMSEIRPDQVFLEVDKFLMDLKT